MTSADRNDFGLTAQKLEEWVTPKISLMEAGDTAGSGKGNNGAEGGTTGLFGAPVGPS